MKNVLKRNDGFAAQALFLAVVVLALIGLTGYTVVKRNHADTKVSHNSVASKDNSDSSPSPDAFINVIQAEGSIVTQQSPKQLAKTADQEAILTSLHQGCSGTDTYVTVNQVVFDGNDNFKQDGNYAVINASRCEPIAHNLEELGGSGSAIYLHKTADNSWKVDLSTQMAPPCSDVSSLGYPKDIMECTE